MGANDPARVKLRVKEWNLQTGHGIVIDAQGFAYPLTAMQLGPEFSVVPPRPLEVLEGRILGPGQVTDITDPRTERLNFDSTGPNPDGDAIASLRGLALEGGRPQSFGRPHNGRFSDGRER